MGIFALGRVEILLVLAFFVLPSLLLAAMALLSVRRLTQRVRQLEVQMHGLEANVPTGTLSPGQSVQQTAASPRVTDVDAATVAPPPAIVPIPVHKPVPPPIPEASAAVPPPAMPRPQMPLPPRQPNVFERVLGQVKHWFTTGNVPVKVGMLVLLAGVAALLRYASQQGWVQLPLEHRFIGVSLAALAALVFGWRKRIAKPAFALAVQGGAIGVLLLVVFAAAKMHAMLPIALAFALSVGLIAGGAVLAVLQNSRVLAVLAVLAGFMAPIWLSTGAGNHVALFSYYALLNFGIFAIVWFKPWRGLMLLGFVFTWSIGTLWGVLGYRSELYASSQFFLVLFFLLYLLMPILHARRQVPGRGDAVNGALLFAMPLLAFALQAGLLSDNRMALAWIAFGVAGLYALLAFVLRGRERFELLSDAHAVLAVAFATLAVPLAFSARLNSALWALEGVALVWFGLRRQRELPVWSGLGLQAFAALAYYWAQAFANVNHSQLDGVGGLAAAVEWPLLNGAAMGGLLLALAGFVSAWLLWQRRRSVLATLLYGWGLKYWFGLWSMEISRFVTADVDKVACYLLFASVSAWLAAKAWRRWQGRALAISVPFALAMALMLNLSSLTLNTPLSVGLGLAWLAGGLLGWRTLQCLRQAGKPEAELAQALWWLGWPVVLMVLADSWLGGRTLASGWQFAAFFMPWLAVLALVLRGARVVMQPLGERFVPWLPGFTLVCLLPVMLGLLISFLLNGSAAPLPWLPLLNPLELMQLLALLLLLDAVRRYRPVAAAHVALGVLGLLWASQLVLRSAHHWGGLPWNGEMFRFSLAQSSLTLLWSVLGVAGWIIGSRRGLRGLWLAAALLMAGVLIKLLLIDRQHLGNLLGIGSFIAYGLLCTVVGYFAPAPPKQMAARIGGDE